MVIKHLTFRSKMTLAVSALVAFLMLATAVGTLSFFEREFEKSLTANQISIVRYLANDLNSTIAHTQEALVTNAAVVPENALHSHDSAYAFLKSRTGLHRLFNSSVMLINLHGQVIAEYPKPTTNIPKDFSGLEFHKKTVSTNQPQISNPVILGKENKSYKLVFTAPVKDSTDRITGILAGSFNLDQPNILSRFTNLKIGKSGHVRIINKEYLLVLHPDNSRIMQRVVPGVIPVVDKAMLDTDTSLRHTNLSGEKLITSASRLNAKEWVLAASYPLHEAFGPIRTARLYFLIAALAGLTAATLIVYYVMRILTRPLQELTEHVTHLSEKSGDAMIFQGDINGEVGRLTDAFNEMVLELENRNQKLLASEERYRIVSDFAADFSFWLRPDYSFEYVSPACKTVTGYSSEELYANPQLIFDMIHPLDREMLMQLKNGSDSNCTRDEFEHRIITKDGATRWVRHTCRQISENNLFMGTRGSLSDITEKKQLADQVTHLVLHDMLTGLPNRSLFTDRLAVALAHEVRQKGGLLPIIFFGLDRFKVINETLGHESGDHLLVMVTKQIRKLLHQDDTLCRFSGDVFAFILSGRESKHEAVTMAYRILAAVSAPYLLGAQQVSITGSIGIVIAPQDGTDPDTLLKNAETAMYEAKRNGKNCFRFYSSDMNAQAAEILKLDSCMPQSLASGDFFLQFQPQLDLKNSRVVAVEALCRWRHPEMGMIPPNRFIPLAEESGFIIKLGEWILRTACSQSVSWRQHGIPPLRVAVNISAKQFSQPDFIDLVSSALSDSGLPADLLELELTESLLVSNEIQTLQKLQALKSMGIHLAIDDFGTGYSSFSYLKHFPLNRLKIDQSFVRDIITDPDDAAITEAIIVMAHVLKLKVIAEGVETVEQLAFLEDHGCDEIQGYYLSKPLSERDLISFVGAYGVEKEGQQ